MAVSATPCRQAVTLTMPGITRATAIPARTTAATKAAHAALLTGEFPDPVRITLPKGQEPAFALAVDSPVPYGVPRGAIVDVAPVRDGRIGRDHTVFADFIPNNWSAWPNTYHRVAILERGPERAVIQSVRDWGKRRGPTVLFCVQKNDHYTTMNVSCTGQIDDFSI